MRYLEADELAAIVESAVRPPDDYLQAFDAAGLMPVSPYEAETRRKALDDLERSLELPPNTFRNSGRWSVTKGDCRELLLAQLPGETFALEELRPVFAGWPDRLVRMAMRGEADITVMRPAANYRAARALLRARPEFRHAEFADPVSGRLLTLTY